MRTIARPERGRRLAALAGLSLAAVLAAQGAMARPLTLFDRDGMQRVAAAMRLYSGASMLRWVVAAPTTAEARALVERLADGLDPAERSLIDRVALRAGPSASAWLEPRIGQAGRGEGCSWQVWVYDPAAPTDEAGATALPVAPGDRFPVGPDATYRVGFTGLVQSRLYAFGETRRGVRDLARVRDVNIPVAADGETESLLLVKSRNPVPRYEAIKGRLRDEPGVRTKLAEQVALAGDGLGKRRGVGSNLQLVSPDMVSRDVAAVPETAEPAPGGEDLVETCSFTLVGSIGR